MISGDCLARTKLYRHNRCTFESSVPRSTMTTLSHESGSRPTDSERYWIWLDLGSMSSVTDTSLCASPDFGELPQHALIVDERDGTFREQLTVQHVQTASTQMYGSCDDLDSVLLLF
jgi:hypothetical protein